MNSITLEDNVLFNMALTALEMDATPAYSFDRDNLSITSNDIDGVADILRDNGIFHFDVNREEPSEDNFRNDVEADADALRSAGFDDEENYCPSIDSFGEE